MSKQQELWLDLVEQKMEEFGWKNVQLARAVGVKSPTITELLKYGKGSDRLKNKVCDVLRIDESWTSLGE
ncbi:TPA: XRE family transcriptional regulator [Streptococcus equi subsp. zooepidemicus]|nr:DNA-binding protein [Streptococcus equi]HES9067564.1 XRE family transcriptional regulator [Streptococcus pyogenes]MCD3398384.1 XRE family transcriptional regulator [Streptococcus equi subsp. zooepidemicus]MCD3450585.1 XRE family transcriptional regulator [Streptococcus equi subsp. zooepidemicus]MCD3464559.1 XRE family transcriptional regulator [Streptococcus equi subsp. zooepidemicus]MCD3466994.1 XRE family transcriptional regulator [Streptococcus equi subsp. zooepidemicus]